MSVMGVFGWLVRVEQAPLPHDMFLLGHLPFSFISFASHCLCPTYDASPLSPSEHFLWHPHSHGSPIRTLTPKQSVCRFSKHGKLRDGRAFVGWPTTMRAILSPPDRRALRLKAPLLIARAFLRLCRAFPKQRTVVYSQVNPAARGVKCFSVALESDESATGI